MLGQQIRRMRDQLGLTQDELADRVKNSKQWISRIETGGRSPSIELLVELYDSLVTGKTEQDTTPASLWLLHWIIDLVRTSGLSEGRKSTLLIDLDRVLAQITKSSVRRTADSAVNLRDVVNSSEPMTIICGDRREARPLTKGDIFAYSISITDLTYLLQLRLGPHVTVRSDKLFVLMDEEYLRAEFGNKHLIIVGSPASNFAARIVNDLSIFRFNISEEARQFWKTFRELDELNDRRYREAFWRLAQGLDAFDPNDQPSDRLNDDEVTLLRKTVDQLLDGRPVKYKMNMFRNPGIIDPADLQVHAQNTRENNDFATISVARNPFSRAGDQRFISIMVAGIHGPGTAHAVRALAEDDFQDHPLGGVIEIELDMFKNWPTRFEQARWRWQTKPYTPDKVYRNLDYALAQLRDHHRAVLANLSELELEAYRNLIGSFTGQSTPAGAAQPRLAHGSVE